MGPEIKKKSKWESIEEIISINDNGIFVSKSNRTNRGAILQVFDESFVLKKREEVKLRYKKKKMSHHSSVDTGGKI
ncbi:MAG: hypothetical protein ACJAWV_000150 [Flammeovirgaceae bacterium]